MYRSILVPLDGSPFGEQALPLALSIARRAGAGLELVNVHETLAPIFSRPVPGLESTLDPELRTHKKCYLDGVAKRLPPPAPVSISTTLLEGSIVDALLDRVARGGTDLVVMTTHGYGPLARF